jgi:hypothetical protein
MSVELVAQVGYELLEQERDANWQGLKKPVFNEEFRLKEFRTWEF